MKTRHSSECLPRRKLVLVGDGFAGKTSLQNTFRLGDFYEEYNATIFENFATTLAISSSEKRSGSQQVELSIWDTAGQEDWDRLRPLSYPHTDILLLCFAVDSPDSFENVERKWMPELQHFCPQVPIVLVGNKTDLRDDQITLDRLKAIKLGPVKSQDGYDMAQRIGAVCYMETSAKHRKGVCEVFEVAARVALVHKRNIRDASKWSRWKKSILRRTSCCKGIRE